MAPTSPPAERFEGFADAQARFFRALAKNQNREWFLDHRAEYERGWRDPMLALLDELRDQVAPFFRDFEIGEPKVFRIFRDVRFSRDKSPYKTRIAGALPIAGGAKVPGGAVALYLHVGIDEYVGAGHYVMDGAQLERYRAAVLDERRGGELARIAARLTKAGFDLDGHETLKKAPRGIDPDHPRVELLKRKGLVATFPKLPKGLIASRALIPWLKQGTKRAAPLVEWLATNA